MNKSLPLRISNISVRQDTTGRYCLNDLHKAAGGDKRHGASYWLSNQQTKELIAELESTGISVVTLEGRTGGTYVVKELVYAYAMWISPAFHLKVIRAYDAMATLPALNPNEISRLQLLEIALQAEQERIELAAKMDRLESRLESIEQHTPTGHSTAIATGKRLYTVQQTVDAYPAFKLGGLRHLIFYSTGKNPNGFAACIRRVGRKILIDADSFEAWIEQRQ
jgi:KilA-N domain